MPSSRGSLPVQPLPAPGRADGGHRVPLDHRPQRGRSGPLGTRARGSRGLPLTSWFLANCHLTQNKGGMRSVELARRLGTRQPTAWLLMHKRTAAMAGRDPGKPRLAGRVEIDTVYLGGQRPGGKRGLGAAGETPFVAGVETTPSASPGGSSRRAAAGRRSRALQGRVRPAARAARHLPAADQLPDRAARHRAPADHARPGARRGADGPAGRRAAGRLGGAGAFRRQRRLAAADDRSLEGLGGGSNGSARSSAAVGLACPARPSAPSRFSRALLQEGKALKDTYGGTDRRAAQPRIFLAPDSRNPSPYCSSHSGYR